MKADMSKQAIISRKNKQGQYSDQARQKQLSKFQWDYGGARLQNQTLL
jgi:hypothetical protein